MVQLGMAAEAGAGRDKAYPADLRMHEIKKCFDVESGAYGEETFRNNELCRKSVRS